VDVADLLELQAALQREGVVEAASDEEAALGVDKAAGEVFDLLTVCQTGLDDLPARSSSAVRRLVSASLRRPLA